MTSVHNSHWSASRALQRSSSSQNREQLLPSSPDNIPLPPSSPVSAPPPPTFPTPDPAAEYGDDDIDDVLFEDPPKPLSGKSSGRSRAVSNLHLQDEKQKTRMERMKKKRTISLPIQISLYNGLCTESNSNYNHLNPTHMFAVLEQIQTGAHSQWYQSPSSLAAPTKVIHDNLGYAVPSRRKSTKDSECVVTSTQEHTYDIINSTQKKVSDETKENGNSSSVPAQPMQPHGTNGQVTGPPSGTTASTTSGASAKGIQPYATFNIMMTNTAYQTAPTDDDDSTYDEVRQPHITIIKMECDGTGDSDAVHERAAKVEPMYAEVTEHGTIVTTHQPFTIADGELIEPYAMVDISYKYKTPKEHKLTSDSMKTCMPINAGLSKMEVDESNKATALTA